MASSRNPPVLPEGYSQLLEDLKERVRLTRFKASRAVNSELISLYWDIGQEIIFRQEQQGWGTKVVERLAHDLRSGFPDFRGFSHRNLISMRVFARAYPDESIAKQLVSQLPWGHNLLIIRLLESYDSRIWYIKQALAHGWSRSVLQVQIESRLLERTGSAPNNFSDTLPPPQSDLAQQMLKDPYTFDFLSLSQDMKERDLEQGLVNHIQKFLLELGVGFAFVGRQFHLTVDEDDYYIDLLFYHLKLRCYVVIELKTQPFKPEFAGKINFYLSAVDDQLRHADDNPSIGLLLTRSNKKLSVDYALRDLAKPIGVAKWQTKLIESLPEDMHELLPSAEQIQQHLHT